MYNLYSSYEYLYLQTIKRQPQQRKITLDILGDVNETIEFLDIIEKCNKGNCEITINRFSISLD